MNTVFRQINEELAREFGQDRITIRRKRNQKVSFRLHFENNDVPPETIARVKAIVNKYMESRFGDIEIIG